MNGKRAKKTRLRRLARRRGWTKVRRSYKRDIVGVREGEE